MRALAIAVLVLAVCLVACSRQPTPVRSAPASPPITTPRTLHADAGMPAESAPAEPTLTFLPADLRPRSAALIDIQCPTGTHRVEKKGDGETHRHCETADGKYEGPIVEFSAEWLRLRGTHDGLRAGIEIWANEGGVVEREFAAGHPVGHYRDRSGTITVAEGNFDAEGRLDGEWIFRMPVSGHELTRTTMMHGTGSIELWDWRYSMPKVTARLQCKDGLLDGTQMFHVLSSPDIYNHRVDGEYHRGLPDGAWTLTRITDDVVLARGQFKAGMPTGVWHGIAEKPCIGRVRGGDNDYCIYGKDLPYTCRGNSCAFDSRHKLTGRSDVERVERDGTTPMRSDTTPHRCELGAPYF